MNINFMWGIKMRHRQKHDRRKSKNIYRSKLIILCITISFLVIAGSTFMAQRVFTYINSVQAKENENTQDDSAQTNIQNNSTKTDIQNDDVPYDTGEFLQKYLYQQMKGEMPDGADGVKVVYLTFDDGPSKTVTPKILDILKSENVHATFFVLGKEIDSSDESKELIKRTVSEGNAIGIHSYSHNYKYLYPNNIVNVDNFSEEVDKTNKSLKNVLGDEFSTKVIRLPGGHMTWKGTEALDKYFTENGYSYIDWNALSKDAEGPKKNSEQLVQEVIKTAGTKQKVILLMHDTYGKEETAKSLPDIIHHFKDNGYEFRVIK